VPSKRNNGTTILDATEYQKNQEHGQRQPEINVSITDYPQRPNQVLVGI
jgi:hypothetical protein